VSRSRRLVTPLLIAAALSLAGPPALAASASGTATSTPSSTPTSTPTSTPASCTGSDAVQIVSQTVTPSTVPPGGSAVEQLTLVNCTGQAVSTNASFYGTWSLNGVPTIPPGCAAIDPFPVHLSFAPYATVTTTFPLNVPVTCTATSLSAKVVVGASTFGSVELTVLASAPTCSASVQYHSWPGGFVTNVTVRNPGAVTLHGWTVGVTFAGDNRVTSAWNAAVTQSNTLATATNLSYNADVPAGSSIAFGAIGTWTTTDGAPKAITLGGRACQLT